MAEAQSGEGQVIVEDFDDLEDFELCINALEFEQIDKPEYFIVFGELRLLLFKSLKVDKYSDRHGGLMREVNVPERGSFVLVSCEEIRSPFHGD